MNLSDLFSETESQSQTINRPSYGLQTFNTYTQPSAVNPHQQQHPSALYRPMSQPVPDVYQQSVLSDLLDYDTAIPTRPSTSPYSQRQQPSESILQQDAYAATQNTFPLSLEAQTSSSSGFGTGLSLPMDPPFEHDGFEAFNDADFDFHNLNSMIGGGANLFQGGRGAAIWDDGAWSAGLAGPGGDDQSGAFGAQSGESGELAAGPGHGSGSTGGNGTIDMFDGLFFG
jgi:hypothetical protein